jgi:hypothetical protein
MKVARRSVNYPGRHTCDGSFRANQFIATHARATNIESAWKITSTK